MKKSSIIRAFFAISLFFFTKAIDAQVQQTELATALNLGQVIEITSSDPQWETMWQVAGESQAGCRIASDNAPEPTDYVTCKNGVCCQTVHYYSFDCACWRFITTCWEEASGRVLARISMW